MSLHLPEWERELDGFPRVSGDEPPKRLASSSPKTFSPRERG